MRPPLQRVDTLGRAGGIAESIPGSGWLSTAPATAWTMDGESADVAEVKTSQARAKTAGSNKHVTRFLNYSGTFTGG